MDSQAFLGELGQRLRAARVRADLGVSELARASGVSRRHVTEAEAGRANISVAKLFALARALDLRVSELVDFEPPAATRLRIALIGLRGAGKSTIGRKLAIALDAPFIELDRRVEELAGLPLASIFELHGAAYFRRLEAEALEKVLAEGDRLVLATGGSIVQSPATYARLRATCRTVWLRARARDHLARVTAQGDRRPMEGRPRALEELEQLLASREQLYERAEVTIDTSELAVDQVVESLRQRFDH